MGDSMPSGLPETGVILHDENLLFNIHVGASLRDSSVFDPGADAV